MKIRKRKITVRLTDAERVYLQQQADTAGMKIEPFVRSILLSVQRNNSREDAVGNESCQSENK